MTHEFQQIKQGRIPAPQTLEFMSEIKTQMALMEQSINEVCKKLDKNAEEHKEIMDKMDKFIEGCDNKYASKNVEKILWGLGGAIGLAVVGAILSQILK